MIYKNDKYVGAYTKEERRNKREKIFLKLSKVGETINNDKCELNCDMVSYLGYQISEDGISPEERLNQKMAEMSTPRNIKNLQFFLEQTSFIASIFPNTIT